MRKRGGSCGVHASAHHGATPSPQVRPPDAEVHAFADSQFGHIFAHAPTRKQANYLLTPSMQERLLKLRETWGTGIQLSLIAGHVHLLIPQGHDWFECDPDRAADDLHQLQGFSEQLISILRIVEELDLNTRLWTKE
jgi:hypothetical protein